MALGSSKARDTFSRLDKLNKESSKPITIRIPTQQRRRLEQLADRQGRSMSEIIRQAIAELLEKSH